MLNLGSASINNKLGACFIGDSIIHFTPTNKKLFNIFTYIEKYNKNIIINIKYLCLINEI